jgi:hypothetical protein
VVLGTECPFVPTSVVWVDDEEVEPKLGKTRRPLGSVRTKGSERAGFGLEVGSKRDQVDGEYEVLDQSQRRWYRPTGTCTLTTLAPTR